MADRQDSYGADGGNLSLEVKAHLYRKINARVVTRIYGLGGKDLFVEDVLSIAKEAMQPQSPCFAYYGITEGGYNVSAQVNSQSGSFEKKVSSPTTNTDSEQPVYFSPLTLAEQSPGITICNYNGDEKK